MSEMNAAISEQLAKLDGSVASIIAMMTGLTIAEINELGGLP